MVNQIEAPLYYTTIIVPAYINDGVNIPFQNEAHKPSSANIEQTSSPALEQAMQLALGLTSAVEKCLKDPLTDIPGFSMDLNNTGRVIPPDEPHFLGRKVRLSYTPSPEMKKEIRVLQIYQKRLCAKIAHFSDTLPSSPEDFRKLAQAEQHLAVVEQQVVSLIANHLAGQLSYQNPFFIDQFRNARPENIMAELNSSPLYQRILDDQREEKEQKEKDFTVQMPPTVQPAAYGNRAASPIMHDGIDNNVKKEKKPATHGRLYKGIVSLIVLSVLLSACGEGTTTTSSAPNTSASSGETTIPQKEAPYPQPSEVSDPQILECKDGTDLYGRTVSLQVDPQSFARGIKGDLFQCIDVGGTPTWTDCSESTSCTQPDYTCRGWTTTDTLGEIEIYGYPGEIVTGTDGEKTPFQCRDNNQDGIGEWIEFDPSDEFNSGTAQGGENTPDFRDNQTLEQEPVAIPMTEANAWTIFFTDYLQRLLIASNLMEQGKNEQEALEQAFAGFLSDPINLQAVDSSGFPLGGHSGSYNPSYLWQKIHEGQVGNGIDFGTDGQIPYIMLPYVPESQSDICTEYFLALFEAMRNYIDASRPGTVIIPPTSIDSFGYVISHPGVFSLRHGTTFHWKNIVDELLKRCPDEYEIDVEVVTTATGYATQTVVRRVPKDINGETAAKLALVAAVAGIGIYLSVPTGGTSAALVFRLAPLAVAP